MLATWACKACETLAQARNRPSHATLHYEGLKTSFHPFTSRMLARNFLTREARHHCLLLVVDNSTVELYSTSTQMTPTKTHQQMLAPDAKRLASAKATPLPNTFPRASRLLTALEKSRMMNATVDKIVCDHQDNQLTCRTSNRHLHGCMVSVKKRLNVRCNGSSLTRAKRQRAAATTREEITETHLDNGGNLNVRLASRNNQAVTK